MDLNGDVQLSFKVLQLFLLFGKIKAVVVEPNFAKGDDMTGFLRVECEVLELMQQSRRASLVSFEGLRRAGMDANGCITKAGLMSQA